VYRSICSRICRHYDESENQVALSSTDWAFPAGATILIYTKATQFAAVEKLHRPNDRTLNEMAQFVLSLREHNSGELGDVTVKGGVIVAWDQTEFYHPASEMHRRFEIGVTSSGRFHSVDRGKLTMASYFADVCAGRVLEDSGH